MKILADSNIFVDYWKTNAKSLADVIIATVAMKYKIPVWTRDKHFKLMQGIFGDLQLF